MPDPHSSPLRPLLRPLAITFAVALLVAFTIPRLHFLRPIAPGVYFPAVFSGLGLVTAASWTFLTSASVAGILDGRPMAHWVIEGERWQAFARRQRQRGKRQRMLVLLVSPLLLLPIVLMADDTDTSFTVWLVASLAGVFGLGIFAATRPGQGAFAASTTRGEVLLCDSYATVAGVLYRWGGLHRRVTSVAFEASLGLFRVHVHSNLGERSTNMEHEIPFPAEAEEEARRVASTLAL